MLGLGLGLKEASVNVDDKISHTLVIDLSPAIDDRTTCRGGDSCDSVVASVSRAQPQARAQYRVWENMLVISCSCVEVSIG